MLLRAGLDSWFCVRQITGSATGPLKRSHSSPSPSPQKQPTMHDIAESMRAAHPHIISFADAPDGITSYARLPPGGAVRMPMYGAGLLLDPVWVRTVYMPRVGAVNHRDIIPMALKKNNELRQHLHISSRFMHHYDHGGHLFLNLCDNAPFYCRQPWLAQRDSHLDAILEILQFTPDEIDQARRNFAWYMITPTGNLEVSFEMTVHGVVSE
ncbi:hypothetical protein D9619_012813 [Psilocybe cf. subviscida]|uniref:Uncharacterized protein n=1 Tax=Psilocybe cf. subviscida TaxID=2480587 RepID=A0A8H5AQ91_9AGAR|nr:hypothetical protein D9619_012813 [Psilocybe cf. subviscida]